MIEHMSAAEYRRQVTDGVEEPENPYEHKLVEGRQLSELKKSLLAPTIKVLPQPTEHQIQNLILERLGLLGGAFFWRENSGLVNVGEGDKKRMFRAGIPGIADIMGVYQGYTIAIEVKRPGKKQSADQRAFQHRFDQCGGVYLVCTDVTQVVNQIMAAISVKKGE